MKQPQTRDEALDQLTVRMLVLEHVTARVIAEMGPKAMAAARASLGILNDSLQPGDPAKLMGLLPQATANFEEFISRYARVAPER